MNDFYSTIKALWYKFCGIVDGINVFKNRYHFISKITHPYIPDMKFINKEIRINPFSVMKDCIIQLEEEFRKFKISRNSPFPINNPAFNKLDLKNWHITNLKFLELTILFSIIKSNFYKRSISLEIPEVELGYHRGLEITTGNEGFFRGGDIITEKLIKCINTPFKWDGFLTFNEWVTSFGQLYGGTLRNFPFFNFFHISLSDELKYFAGSYFFIAHEVCHSLLINSEAREEVILKGETQLPVWFLMLRDIIKKHNLDFMKKLKRRIRLLRNQNKKKSICYIKQKKKILCPIFHILKIDKIFEDILKECLLDYFAIKIGGPFYLVALIDYIPKYEFNHFIRVSFTIMLLTLKEDKLLQGIENIIIDKMQILFSVFMDNELCPECILSLLDIWTDLVKGFDEDFIKVIIFNYFLPGSKGNLNRFKLFFPSITDQDLLYRRSAGNIILKKMSINTELTSDMNLKNIEQFQFKNLFNYLILEPYIPLNSESKTKFINCIKKGIPIKRVNPLILLNIYYECFLTNDKIDYYTFLYSVFKSKF